MKRPTGGAAVVLVLVLVLLFLPLVYILSVGPAIWLHSSGAIGPTGTEILEAVYFPLEWSSRNVPLVGPLIMRYADLWHRPTAAVPLPAPPAAVPAPAVTPTPTSTPAPGPVS
jgi:hypothetical protein